MQAVDKELQDAEKEEVAVEKWEQCRWSSVE
jgi:hypothetical protein